MSQEIKVRKIAEGKTKIIREIIGTNEVMVESKDDITAGDGLKHDIIKNKSVLATATTCHCFELLNSVGIATHFIARMNNRIFRAQRLKMIPIEIVVRRIATGSYLQRDPETEEGTVFYNLVTEFFLKDDQLHDPSMIWYENRERFELFDAHKPLDREGYLQTLFPKDVNLAWDSRAKVRQLCEIAKNVFIVLEKAWKKQRVVLVDLKIECGLTQKGDKLLVADVIDNDSWRIWPGGDKSQMKDKQVYRNLKAKTPEALKRIERNYQWVANKTSKFIS